MSNIDKQALRQHAERIIELESDEAICHRVLIDAYEKSDQLFTAQNVLALLDELEAKDKCIAEQVEIIAKQDKWIKDVEATMISATDRAEVAENRVTELEAMLARLYTECDTGERRGNGSQSGVAMPSWVTVEAARLLLGVK